jgi:hypothetical protein
MERIDAVQLFIFYGYGHYRIHDQHMFSSDNKQFSLRLPGLNFTVVLFRYFLRKLQKVKKAHGQLLAINEVFNTSCSWCFDSSEIITEAVDVVE